MDEARETVRSLLRGADLRRYKGEDPRAALDELQRLAAGLPGRSVVYLEAPTAAGKSTLADALRKALGSRIKIFPVDRYFKNGDEMPAGVDGNADFDRPESLFLDRAAADVRALLDGARVELPIHDMATQTTRFDSGEFMELRADEVLIVDSIYASHASLLDTARGHRALNVFLYAPAVARLARRLRRDLRDRGRSIEANLRGWRNILYDEREFILPLHRKADRVLNLTEEEELGLLPETYAELLAEEFASRGARDAALLDLFESMLRETLRADEAQAGEFIAVREGRGESAAGRSFQKASTAKMYEMSTEHGQHHFHMVS